MSSKFDGATVTILNWEKFNPRKDLKATNWLRLQNTLFEDPNFFDFDHSELLFWIYLLSIASKKMSGEIRFNQAHAERIGRFNEVTIEEAFARLEEFQCVQITLIPRHAGVTSTSRARHTTNERTNETNVTKRNETNVTVPTGVNPDRSLNVEIWDSYREAYKARYQVEPTRNATVNAQISQLAKRLGKDAVEVVRFYIAHNKAYYVQSQHTVGPMLKDAEALHTQWQRGDAVLTTKAREIERTQHNFNAWDRAFEIAEGKGGEQ